MIKITIDEETQTASIEVGGARADLINAKASVSLPEPELDLESLFEAGRPRSKPLKGDIPVRVEITGTFRKP